MRIAFWISVLVIFYTYFGYPLIMLVWSRLAPRRWRAETFWPQLTVIMAVHNGQRTIADRVESLLKFNNPAPRELIVVSDGSTDQTNGVLEAIQDPRLHVVVLERNRGKAAALNTALEIATGEIVLFTDVRPQILETSVEQLLRNFADPEVGCVGGELILSGSTHDGTTRAVGGLYWKMEQWIRRLESRTGSVLGVYGGFYAIRRALAKPFPEDLILDDMFQPLSVVHQGYRAVLDENAVVVDEWPTFARGEFRRKVRTLAGNFQLLARLPWLLSRSNKQLFQFVSHKILRLIVPFMLVLALFTSLALSRDSVSFATAAMLQLFFYMLACTEVIRIRVLSRVSGPAAAFVLLNVAVVVAAYRYYVRRESTQELWVGKSAAGKSNA